MKLIEDWKLKNLPRRKRAGVFILGISSVFLVVYLGGYLFGVDAKSAAGNLALWAVMLLAILVAVVVLHEGLHGLFFWIFSGKVRFGAKLKTPMGPVFWASSPGSLIPRTKFQIIALAPQSLTVVLFLILALVPLSNTLAYVLLVAAALNLSGGCLDIFVAILLRRYPRSVLIKDMKEGFEAYERA